VKVCLALLVALLVGGCSSARILYNNADVYLKWKLEGYLAPEGDQVSELSRRVEEFLAWHRLRALPQYATIADDAARRLARGLSRDDVVWGYDAAMAQARESVRAAAERIAPLLDRLTPAQVSHLEGELGADNRKFARDNLRGGEPERRRRRMERNVERLEDWVGALSREQVERVARYSERAPLLEEFRDRDRRRLQAELLSMVRSRNARERLADAAANWERGREPAYAAAYEASRREYVAMVLDIDRSLSSEQRARAVRKLRGWAQDFRALAAGR
jgi:hypothetical protein